MDDATRSLTAPAEDDAVLIRAFQAGDTSSFDKLVLKHKDRLFNLCYRFLGDYHEANDAAQDIFIRAYRSLQDFRFESAFSTWLHRIAVNTCKNKLSSFHYRLRKKTVSIHNPGVRENHNTALEIREESSSALNGLERKETLMMIQKALNALPVEQKIVMTLRDVEGLSYEEIAQITGLQLGTVKSKLSRARQAVKEKLRGWIPNGMS